MVEGYTYETEKLEGLKTKTRRIDGLTGLSAGSRSDDQAVSAAGRRRTGGGGLTGGRRHLAGVARGGTSGHSFRRGLALELTEVHANTTRGFRSDSRDDDGTQSRKGGRR
jgi:hypothetical protein